MTTDTSTVSAVSSEPEMIKKYILVTKPGIIFANLVTAAGGFLLASKGRIDMAVLLSFLTGISL